MNLKKLENENIEQYIWRLGTAKDQGLIDESWADLATIINKEAGDGVNTYSESTYSKPYRQAKRFYDAGVFTDVEGKQPIPAVQIEDSPAQTTINKDGTYTSDKLLRMDESQAKDPSYILAAHGFDPERWSLVSARNSIKNTTRAGEVLTLYASSITAKPIKSGEAPLEKMGEFFDRLDRRYSLPDVKENYAYREGDKMLLIDIADLHMNLQASVFTTGNEYNCDIAERLFFYVIEDVITRTRHYDFDEIVFTVGGDMLNTNDLRNTTAKGTPQDSDVHYYDAYERMCAMTVKAIDVLRRLARVSVIYVPGNHDELAGFKLAKYIDAWFRNDDGVTVDYAPLARKYKLFGTTLMCFTHDGDVKKLPQIVANEAREYWAKAETVEVFLQHLHTEQVLVEDNNMRIQRLPTISAKSKWSADKGYCSKRQCKTFVFDKEEGLTDVLYTPIRKETVKEDMAYAVGK